MRSFGYSFVADCLFVIFVLDLLVSILFVSPRVDALELCKVLGMSAIGSGAEEVEFEIDLSQLIVDVPVIILAKAWGQGYAKSYFSRNA